MSSNTIKTVAVFALLVSSAFVSGQAQAGTCKTVQPIPGVVQLFATVQGEADDAFCSAVHACPTGSRKVEVFGAGIGQPGAIVAAAATGRTANRDIAVASCDTTLANKHGVGVGVCQDEASPVAGQGDVVENECSLYVAGLSAGKTAANATCFCGE
ncbi:hypothetical protein [Lysobacter sp.]|uniref:hypothetical protein n=1 Tax=Lysobacter sp. TaxID=72226 RepID=UPI002D365E68|nr:hypothetical protein [Lysobacter sp.]HZX78178.1 hypothetical protein [Lysobacter sp.]